MGIFDKVVAMFDVTLMVALMAGLVSFASPCVLPIVPFYISYMAGTALSDLNSGNEISPKIQRKAIINAVLFSIGMIFVFVGIGATATAFGSVLRDWFGFLRWVASGVILLMGLHFLGILKIMLLNRQLILNLGNLNSLTYGMAFLLGLAFAFGWTPCVGPILAAILFIAAGNGSMSHGVLLLICYGVGMTAPFILAATLIKPFLKWATDFRKHLGKVEKATGVILIIFAFLIASNSVGQVAGWMLKMAPDFWNLG